jgi:hypothetical protein
MVCLDDVQRLYTMARACLPRGEPRPTDTVYLREIASLATRLDERFKLLPSQMRSQFEVAMARARG